MRRLLRGRHGAGPGSRLAAVALLVAVTTPIRSAGVAAQAPAPATPAIHITSPLGRTDFPGRIRIVARLDAQGAKAPDRVEFYVDDLLVGTDTDGPPYDALWTDENPFEQREIIARAELPTGAVLTDRVVLKPLELTDATEVTSVAVDVSVLDAKGRFIPNLSAADFELLEDAAPQTIDLVAERREPALFTLLVDSSQSMALRADAVRAAARRLLDPLNKDDKVLVAPFSRAITSVTGPTTDRQTVLDAIAAIRPSGGTAILDSLQEAARIISPEHERRAVILITDGYDEHSTSAFMDTIQALRKSSVTVYVIGVGGVAGISLKGEKVLSQLAEMTGGRAWFPRDDRRIAEAYETAAADVQHKYLLTYTPANQRRDGLWRALTVRTRVPDAQVHTRSGYTAPLAPPVRASMEFTAISSGDRPAALTIDDVELLEDGVPQKLDTFQEAVLPVTFMLALDASGSMKNSADAAKTAARSFVEALRPEDDLGMILFADKAEFINAPMQKRDPSLAAIDRYAAQGGTALYDAVYDCLAQVSTVSGRRVVVIVTDGRDENAASNGPGSLRTWDEVLRKLPQSGATVYTVGVGSRVDRAKLQQLADDSGGAAYFPADVTTLASEYHRILDELRRRYVVAYESSNRLRDGSWRKVQMRARDRKVTLRSGGGYFAPAQ